MPRKYKSINCPKTDIIKLNELAQDPTQPRLSIRAQMVLQCIEGRPIKDISADFSERPNTVIFWRDRFAEQGVEGLLNRPRGKNANQYGTNLQDRIVELIDQSPPDGHKRWTGKLLAQELGIPPDVVWRCLRKADIKLTDEHRPKFFVLEIPVQLIARKETTMSNSNSSKMDLEITARITGKDGTEIEKVIKMEGVIPDINDFDLSTKEGFLQDLDVYEKAVLDARDQLAAGLTQEFLAEASKKNGKSGNKTNQASD